MTEDGVGGETFVVRAGLWRTALLGPVMLLAALVFFFLAFVLVYASADNSLAKLAFAAIALVLAALAVYFLLILTMLGQRVEVAPDAVRLRVPNWRGGVMPWFPWIRTTIPYADIAAVECREEVNSSFGIIMMQKAYSLVTRTGRRIVFGYTSPLTTANFPYPEAAARIARKAGVAVRDRGAVRSGGVTPAIVKGYPDWSTPPMSEEERAGALVATRRAMLYAFLLAVIALSIRACVQH
jgi:hypothetical protein